MSAVKRYMPNPPATVYALAGELFGFQPITIDLVDADQRTRLTELGAALGRHVAEDRSLEFWLGRLPDGRFAVVPVDTYAGAGYALEVTDDST